jgi:hypothetical protein
MNQIHINFPNIQEIAMKGVRRTAVFMGLGVNAANDPDFKQYELTKLTEIQFIPPNVDENTLTNFKTEFGRWVVGCGLRELIETFSVFLDRVYFACLLIGASCNQIPHDKVESRNKKFQRDGLRDKLDTLRNNFGVGTSHSGFLLSINQARNCVTHRRGIVGPEDCSSGSELVVKWEGIDIYAETPDGKVISLQPVPEGGVHLPEGGHVKVKISERSRVFAMKSVVSFSPRELAEICHFVLRMTGDVIQSAETYAKNSGVPMTSNMPASQA